MALGDAGPEQRGLRGLPGPLSVTATGRRRWGQDARKTLALGRDDSPSNKRLARQQRRLVLEAAAAGSLALAGRGKHSSQLARHIEPHASAHGGVTHTDLHRLRNIFREIQMHEERPDGNIFHLNHSLQL